MATRKAAPETTVDADMPKKAGVRDLETMVPKIRELKDEGKTVPEICDALDMSYHVVNQIMTQSYKMTMDTVAVFERQERMRLGLTVDE